jgi:hypothetical protein
MEYRLNDDQQKKTEGTQKKFHNLHGLKIGNLKTLIGF